MRKKEFNRKSWRKARKKRISRKNKKRRNQLFEINKLCGSGQITFFISYGLMPHSSIVNLQTIKPKEPLVQKARQQDTLKIALFGLDMQTVI